MLAVATVLYVSSVETIFVPTFQPTNSPVSVFALAPFVASAPLSVIEPSVVEATVTTTPASSLATASLRAAVAASTSSCVV
jgi:hypothetical protein